MPQIPEFLPDVNDFVRRAPPVVDPAAMAAPGHALARAGAEFGAEMNEWEQKQIAARQQADAANALVSASSKMTEAQFHWSKVPDNLAARDGFAADAKQITDATLAGIADPAVKAHVQRSLAEQTIARGFETRTAAWGLESSTRRGELDQRMQAYSEQAASATDPLLAAHITDQALADIKGTAAAGWIHPEEAAQHEINFKSAVQEIQARRMINGAINTQDPLRMRAVEAGLADPSQFPGMRSDRREALQQFASINSQRLENRALAQQAHGDAVAEREQRRVQGTNEARLLTMPLDQLPDDAGLAHLVETQQISAAGVSAAEHRRDRLTEGTDKNAPLLLDLLHRHGAGEDVSGDALRAYQSGDISRHSAVSMAVPRTEQSPIEKTAFARIKSVLGNVDTDAFEKLDDTIKTQKRLTWAAAQGEFYERTRTGEKPDQVADDILRGYGTPTPPPPQWGIPKLGPVNSLGDVQKVWAATQAKHEAHQMSDGEFNAEAARLARFGRWFQTQPAGGPTGAAPVKPNRAPKPGTPEFDALPQTAKDYLSGARPAGGEVEH